MKRSKRKVDFFGYLFTALSIVCIPYFIYLFLQYKTFVENYNLFPALFGRVFVLPLFCIALSYSLLWWCKRFLFFVVDSIVLKRCFIAAAVLILLVYYALMAGYFMGAFHLNSFLIFMMEHAYLLFPIGVIFYLGVNEKG